MGSSCVKPFLAPIIVAAIALTAPALTHSQQNTRGPGLYKVLKMLKVGGEGGFDYIFADAQGRRLYIPRGGPSGLTVFNLDTLESTGAI